MTKRLVTPFTVFWPSNADAGEKQTVADELAQKTMSQTGSVIVLAASIASIS